MQTARNFFKLSKEFFTASVRQYHYRFWLSKVKAWCGRVSPLTASLITTTKITKSYLDSVAQNFYRVFKKGPLLKRPHLYETHFRAFVPHIFTYFKKEYKLSYKNHKTITMSKAKNNGSGAKVL